MSDRSQPLLGTDTVQQDYGLTGEGYTAAMWDFGLAGDHQDLADNVRHQDSDAVSYHATHIGGILAGQGIIDPTHHGIAPDATLLSYAVETASKSNLYAETANAASQGAVVSHNSWGWSVSSPFGNYDSFSTAYDQIVAGDTPDSSRPLSVVFPSGNYRNDVSADYDTIPGTGATAKNTITVGAVERDGTMTDFSSWGPTDDGRIKPDVMAPGRFIVSTRPGDEYGYKSGTSVAAPFVSGGIVLINEAFEAAHGSLPAPATVKAVLIHTADDIESTGPDYRSGWGIADIDAAVAVVQDAASQHLIETSTLTDATDSDTYELAATAGDRVTLVWTDPAGETLVNDLELVVTAADGTRFYPWTLSPGTPADTATQTRTDHRNPVEQVVIPETGTVTVTVKSADLPQGTQSYALVTDSPFSAPSTDTSGSTDTTDSNATDTADTSSDSDAGSVDDTPPSLDIISPERRTYRENPITFELLTDEPLAAASYTVDGETHALMEMDNNRYAATTTVSNGFQTASFTVADAAGNTNTAAVKFYVDAEPISSEDSTSTPDASAPVLTVHAPAGAYTESPVPLRYTSNEELVEAWYRLDEGGSVALSGNTTVDADTGNHTLTVFGTDAAGNEGSTTTSFTVEPDTDTATTDTSDVPDTTAPQITVHAPDGAVTGDTTAFTISADEPLDGAWVTVNRKKTYVLALSEDSYTGVFPVTTGLNTAYFIAHDAAGNYAYKSVTFNVG